MSDLAQNLSLFAQRVGQEVKAVRNLTGDLSTLQTSEKSSVVAAINIIVTAIGKRVRFDAAQTLSGAEKAQALSNIGAVSSTAVGDTDTNFVTTFENALVS